MAHAHNKQPSDQSLIPLSLIKYHLTYLHDTRSDLYDALFEIGRLSKLLLVFKGWGSWLIVVSLESGSRQS
jgi:hypothetical protein